MTTYGKYKNLFKTSVKKDKLIVDVLTKNTQFLSFLKNNINNGPYLVRWYKEKEDRLKEFEKYGATSQVKSQADSYFGILIRDNIKYFSQNKVEYREIYNQQKDAKLNIQKEEILPKEKKNKHFLEKDIKKAANVLTESFFDYPTYSFSLPNPEKRKKKLQVLFEILVKYSIKYSEIYATSKNLEGIMLCMPPNNNISNWKMIKCGALRIPFRLGIRFITQQDIIDKIQDKLREKHANFPHTYLWAIGVVPDSQKKGFGTKLIRALLDDLKEKNEPCYLETGKKINVEIYRHFGFELVEDYHIDEINIDIFSMIWKP